MTLYNLNIERGILSTIIFEPILLVDAMMVIDKSDFFLPAHQSIFAAMVELENDSKAIDEELLQIQLKKSNSWDEDVFTTVISASAFSSLPTYLQELKSYRQRRGLNFLALNATKALNAEKDNEEIIESVSKTLEKISTHGAKHEPSISQIADSFELMMQEAQESGGELGEKSGIDSLDRILGGFIPGDLVIIAARPSMGKTVLATTIADNVLDRGVGVHFDSLEMPSSKLFHRLMAKRSGESLNDLKRGVISNYDNYRKAMNFFKSKKNFFIQDESYIPIGKLKAKAIRKFRKDKSIKFWIIDHLRYIKKDSADLARETGEITKELKKIAKEYGVVVILLSQINREVNNRANNRPQLTDLRDSGAIEEDADIVLMPHRDSYYSKGEKGSEASISPTDIIIAKNRDGRTGIAKTNIHFNHSKFEDGGIEIEYHDSTCDASIGMELPEL